MSKKYLSIYFMSLMAFVSQLFAASGTWDLLTGGDWDDDDNWSPSTYPNDSGQIALFDVGKPNQDATISLDTVTIAISELIIDTDHSMTFSNGTFNFNTSREIIVSAAEGKEVEFLSSISLDAIPTLITNRGEGGSLVFFNDLDLGATDIEFRADTGEIRIDGDLAGTGIISKTGTGTLELNGNNDSYAGTIEVLAGTLSGTGGSGAGIQVDITNSGTVLFNQTSGSDYSGTITNSGTVVFNQTSDGECSGNLEGSGDLIKEGSGTLTLSGSNTYTGFTLINEGILKASGSGNFSTESVVILADRSGAALEFGSLNEIQNLSGGGSSGGNIISTSSANLNILGGESAVYAGTIEGPGGVRRGGPGIFTLSGDSSEFTGTIGMLNIGTISISSWKNIGSSGIILFTNDGTNAPGRLLVTGTFSTSKEIQLGNPDTLAEIDVEKSQAFTVLGNITANNSGGTLTKTGGGKLILGQTTDYSYDSDFILSEGTLVLKNGVTFPSSSFTIESAGTLRGNGTIGDGSALENYGAIYPGASIGTLTVDGDYTQDSSGSLFIDIQDDGQSDLLSVTGTATLGGTLVWNAAPGIYFSGDEFLFLTASSIADDFDTVLESHDFINADITGDNSTLYLTISNDGPVTPVSNDDLCGNPRQVADYLFCPMLPDNQDLINVMREIVKLSPDEYDKVLSRISPVQMWALPQAVARNDTQIANFDYSRYLPCCQNNRTYLWVAPLISYYHQDERVSHCGEFERKRDLAFNVYSRGFSLGHLWAFNRINCGVHADYLFSSLRWSKNGGKADLNAFYFAPFFDYFFKHCHLSSSLVLSRTFYDVDRRIRFGTIDRTAHHNHRSWNCLVRAAAKSKLPFSLFQKNFFICPEAAVNYLNIWESSYRERGANSINLSVDSKYSAFLNPRATLTFIKEFLCSWGCVSASFCSGWEGFISLAASRYDHSSFVKQETCQPSFSVEGFNTSVHQAILGTKLELSRSDHLGVTFHYEAGLNPHSYTHEGSASFIWKW